MRERLVSVIGIGYWYRYWYRLSVLISVIVDGYRYILVVPVLVITIGYQYWYLYRYRLTVLVPVLVSCMVKKTQGSINGTRYPIPLGQYFGIRYQEKFKTWYWVSIPQQTPGHLSFDKNQKYIHINRFHYSLYSPKFIALQFLAFAR